MSQLLQRGPLWAEAALRPIIGPMWEARSCWAVVNSQGPPGCNQASTLSWTSKGDADVCQASRVVSDQSRLVEISVSPAPRRLASTFEQAGPRCPVPPYLTGPGKLRLGSFHGAVNLPLILRGPVSIAISPTLGLREPRNRRRPTAPWQSCQHPPGTLSWSEAIVVDLTS